ncbi:hypothetical protein [Mycobacterium interjectum]|uniref:hypothetical protein n=1 Tax=Mycobacterium interjectum TaxID=33895 RepID=UPI0035572927
MKHRWFLVGPLTVVMLAAGCAVNIGGKATPAPGLAPPSLGRPAVDHVLLGDDALSRILKQPLNLDLRFPPQFGAPRSWRTLERHYPTVVLGSQRCCSRASTGPATSKRSPLRLGGTLLCLRM